MCIVAMVAGFFAGVCADGQASDKAAVSFVHTGIAHAQWQLQTNQAPLTETLNEIQRVSGLRIHFSALPKQAVSATCVADELEQVLKCLLGNSVNLVFSRPVQGSVTAANNEVWILGSSLNTSEAQQHCAASMAATAPVNTEEVKGRTTEQLLADVNADNEQRRAEAVFDLAQQTDANPAEVEAVLLKGLTDQSGLVRSQALTAWTQRQGEAALPELQQALSDVDSSVRIQAVELTENVAMLNQALHDQDAFVRQLAQAKLQSSKLK